MQAGINNINWDLLLSFFGKSPMDEDFDQFLLELGIKKRPKGQYKFESIMLTKNDGLELGLCAREYYIDLQRTSSFPAQSEYWYILTHISILDTYTGILPFDLKFDFTNIELEKRLGKAAPGKFPDDEFFYYKKFVVPITYKTDEKNGIRNIQITMPVEYNIDILKAGGIHVND